MATQTVNLESAIPQPSISEARPLHRLRLVFLDNLRTVLITSVVLGHLSGSYGLDVNWIYREGGEVSPVVSILELIVLAIGIGFAKWRLRKHN